MTAAETLTALISATPASERAALAGELARALASVFALNSGTAPGARAEPSIDVAAPLLTVGEAAARLGVPASWLYRHARKLPFARKLGNRTLRFDAPGLERWARTRP